MSSNLRAVTRTGLPARMDVDLAAAPGELLARHRARLAQRLVLLGAQGWRLGTRCPLWDVADVVTHLGDATEWGLEAIAAAAGGARPSFLQDFDPRRTPHEYVTTRQDRAPAALLARMGDLTRALAERLGEADRPQPPAVPWVGGHTYTPGLVALHILWDSWLHELDMAAALGAAGRGPEPPRGAELDAVAAYTVFFAGVAVSFRLGPGEQVSLRVDLRDLAYDLDIGAAVRLSRASGTPRPGTLLVTADAVAGVEAMAGRGDLASVAEGDPRAVAVLGALGVRMAGPGPAHHTPAVDPPSTVMIEPVT